MKHIMPRTAPGNAKGVTLVELMVVVALIAVIAAIASPGITRGIERANARAASREVAAQLRLARNQAMSRGAPFWVQISPAAGASRGSVAIFRHPTADVRSCREFAGANLVEVSRFSLNTISGRSALQTVVPAGVGAGAINLCFAPDGRVLAPDGTNLATTGGGRCQGEGAYVLVWDESKTASSTVKDCAASTTVRPAQRDDRDLINLFKVSIPYNGTISVNQ
jgi:prepilin-type N-terminal cleavage/methylation domain-containing protein